jgi:hypothetical protein
VTCRADSLRNLLGEPRHSHRPPSVCHRWSSLDEPKPTHCHKTLEAQSLSASEAPCEVPSALDNRSLRTFSGPGTRLDRPSRSRGRLFAPRPGDAVVCLAGSLRNLFGNPQHGPRRPSVCHRWPSSDEPSPASRVLTLVTELLRTPWTSCEAHVGLGNSAFRALPRTSSVGCLRPKP